MPELPEVETIRRGLELHLAGRRLTAVQVLTPKLRRPVPKGFLQALVGLLLVRVRRRSKYLLLEMEQEWSLVIHLGMSGRLLLETDADAATKHTHLILEFEGLSLVFRDPRRFGFVEVVKQREIAEMEPFASLGPEPLSDAFTAEYCLASMRGLRQSVKAWLMDQRRVAGIGNIYANEALFRAGILPQRPAGTLTAGEIERLAASVKSILQQAVELGGTTLSDFVNSEGDPGYFQNHLEVYQRAGKPCSRCGGIIEKSVTAGRSTFFCSTCQK
ncbi:MAG: bifunctional DNA-formamidopyrimidine glycosylase/DNA-(apurinic or apyrimidinic site) lyase [candidate division KSB1 bacterium]|nr:bifunctional DNA-formamidopyrimidine glycosylase/DNA-(apurinic or apyrimidinic site) lyase [candidate division KSB1 bacterium]MDZ7345942.1 bifunctional DNA-formamidopyrimidine glycosylase/DNA-(apurinic or apyrimidinic site) lyase [candidate division KSB1 bacterium]